MGGEILRSRLSVPGTRRAAAGLLAAGMLVAGCDSGSFPTAPTSGTGSVITLTMTANPTTITATGSSTIEVQISENNLPVRVGTEVRVTTNLGQISKPVITTDPGGLAFTTLVADGRLGDATVTATSGANTKTATVKIGDTTLKAGFTCTGSEQTVIFIDSSSGATLPNAWSWDFGDDTGSSEQDPVHTYAADGIYLTTLTVSNEGAQDSVSKFVTVPGGTC